jgi:DNA-binding response OmpR family regulator
MTATRPHHILVVDDEPVNLTLLSKRLAQRGYQVSTAESADQALAVINADRPDIVLLDIFMPKVSGVDLLRTLREAEPTKALPVILVSALGDTSHIVRGLAEGANDYVTKPVNQPILVARIEALLRSSAMVRRLEVQTEILSRLAAYDELDAKISEFAALPGTLAGGSSHLLAALRLRDDIGQLEYKVAYFASLWYDQDQRDNQINAKQQQVQILFAKDAQASAWFDPEILRIPLEQVRAWMAESPALAVYRFALEELYRQQDHVLDDKGEHLLSLASRFESTPNDAYSALSTADAQFPIVRLSDGSEVTLTYGQYRAILSTNRNQEDRAAAFLAFHRLYEANANTYASLYNGVIQRDWFMAQARGYRSTLDMALHGNNIPTAVVENLIETTKQGVEPLRRYHPAKRVAGLSTYHAYDTTIPLVDFDRTYPVKTCGTGCRHRWRLSGRTISGSFATRSPANGSTSTRPQQRSGAYSAPVWRASVCCSTTTTRSTRSSRWRTRWGTRCTRSSRTAPAVRLPPAHLRGRSRVDAERSAVSRLHAVPDHRSTRVDLAAPAFDRRHRRHVLHAGDVRGLRAAGAPAGGGGRPVCGRAR